MSKIEEARHVLQRFGLPSGQRNEIAALTLLVLAQLSEQTPWTDARRQSLRIHDMLAEMRERYNREYAENTRETVRRQVLHQFEQAGIVIRNPDDSALATNSPRTHYALTDLAIQTIRRFGTPDWEQAVAGFAQSSGSLFEVYQRRRQQSRIPLRYQGQDYHLSPGKHNELQVAIIEKFGPTFAPGAKLLYLGDTAKKKLIVDEANLTRLGIPISDHDKLPDVVLYDEERNRLLLIEAVTSHGPVSPKRYVELEAFFRACSAGRIYVSAFPDFATFKTFLTDIAWDTEVWLSEIPDHLIHFNGDQFLTSHHAT